MPVNRHIWTQPLTETSIPQWPCPHCNRTDLKIKENSLHFDETRKSRELHGEDGWEPEWIEGKFSCLVKCSYCSETITISGIQHLDLRPTERDYFEYFPLFYPNYISPSPNLFTIPENIPPDVTNEIHKAFELYWVDLQACANKVRSILEILLTYKRINRYIRINNKGRKALNLHQRIELFAKVDPDLAESLMAVKWIGNTGSHGSVLQSSDIFDGFDLLQHSLDRMFDDKDKKITRIRKEIIRRKGPRKN